MEEPAAVAVGQVEEASRWVLENFPGLAVAAAGHGKTRRQEMPDEGRRERIGNIHRAHALVVPGDVDEARRALVLPWQMRACCRAAAGTSAVADELALLRIEHVGDMREPEG